MSSAGAADGGEAAAGAAGAAGAFGFGAAAGAFGFAGATGAALCANTGGTGTSVNATSNATPLRNLGVFEPLIPILLHRPAPARRRDGACQPSGRRPRRVQWLYRD
jgi:hypothetical protein